MTGFKPRSCGLRSDHCTSCATTALIKFPKVHLRPTDRLFDQNFDELVANNLPAPTFNILVRRL